MTLGKPAFNLLGEASGKGIAIASQQQSVYVNGRKAMTPDGFIGPSYSQPLGSIVLTGSSKVFVEGRPFTRVGDQITNNQSTNNQTATKGSEDVFVG